MTASPRPPAKAGGDGEVTVDRISDAAARFRRTQTIAASHDGISTSSGEGRRRWRNRPTEYQTRQRGLDEPRSEQPRMTASPRPPAKAKSGPCAKVGASRGRQRFEKLTAHGPATMEKYGRQNICPATNGCAGMPLMARGRSGIPARQTARRRGAQAAPAAAATGSSRRAEGLLRSRASGLIVSRA
jgi:hypothetical protein